MTEYIRRDEVLKKAAPIHGCFCNMISSFDVVNLLAYDVAPVVHGRWEYFKHLGIAVCSECGFERELDYNFGKAVSCPNCGAKMGINTDVNR